MKTILHDTNLTITKQGFTKQYKNRKEYNLAKLNALIEISGLFFPYSRYKELAK